MIRTEIEANLKSNGWKQDRWGHWQIVIGDRNYRIKMGKIGCRFESKGEVGRWINRNTEPCYYKDVILKSNSKGKRAMLIGHCLLRMENIPCM